MSMTGKVKKMCAVNIYFLNKIFFIKFLLSRISSGVHEDMTVSK